MLTRHFWIWPILTSLFLLGACSSEEPPVSTPRQASQAKVSYDREALVQSLETLGLAPSEDALAEERVQERFSDLPCAVPEEVALLFSHQAGTAPALNHEGVRGFTAERAHAVYDSLRQGPRWRPNWIPVLRADDGWLAVESSRGSSPAGPVLWVDDDGQAEVRATNLTVLLGEWSKGEPRP